MNFFSENKNLSFHLHHPLMEKIVRLKENNYSEKDEYPHAPLDYEDAMDSYEKVLEIIGGIAADTIAPNAESVDAEGPKLENNEVVYARGTQENHDTLVKAGVVGLSLPRKYNGLNFSIVPYVMSAEIISRADAGFGNIWGLQDCAETLHEFASDEIKDNYLPRFNKGATAAMDLTEPDAGSDLQAVQLKADFDEKSGKWMLNGVKRFITNGDANISLVLARSEEGTRDARGLSLFVYDRNSQAVVVRRIENKLGIKGSPTCELVFKEAPAEIVGDRKLGLIKYVMALMNSARLGVGAQSVGIAQAAYEEALSYAREREQFGKAIIQYPAVYEMITMMRVKTDAARTLLYETCRMVDMYKCYGFAQEERKLLPEERKEMKYYQRNADVFTPLLKLMASEYCNQVAYDALQVHGGSGYMKDYPVERIFRDARITNIYEGTSQLQVVAAIRGVTNGAYLKRMQEYYDIPVKPEFEYLHRTLGKMMDQYAKTVEKVIAAAEDMDDYLTFMSRRLVEMAGNVVIGYLLLIDANRDADYTRSADIFVRKGKSENISIVSFINNFNVKDLDDFRL